MQLREVLEYYDLIVIAILGTLWILRLGYGFWETHVKIRTVKAGATMEAMFEKFIKGTKATGDAVAGAAGATVDAVTGAAGATADAVTGSVDAARTAVADQLGAAEDAVRPEDEATA